MSNKTIDLDYKNDGGIAIIYLNREKVMNALNQEMANEFVDVVKSLRNEQKARVVIVTGRGNAFCAGGDLLSFKSAEDPKEFLHGLAKKFHEGIIIMRDMDAPFIAAINGACMGVGLSLACACDIRIAAANAKFSVAFTGVGLSPDSGLPFFLPRIVGLGIATELAYFNPVFDAKHALEIHLINKIARNDNVLKDALEYAEKLLNMPTKALGMVKKLQDLAYSDTLDEHLAKELKYVSESAATNDFQEGVKAFFEKRKPAFKGN
ncbi:MAG: enoyl-CoA hydratase/isomerase family protein [Promethearchaeota archaeon]